MLRMLDKHFKNPKRNPEHKSLIPFTTVKLLTILIVCDPGFQEKVGAEDE